MNVKYSLAALFTATGLLSGGVAHADSGLEMIGTTTAGAAWSRLENSPYYKFSSAASSMSSVGMPIATKGIAAAQGGGGTYDLQFVAYNDAELTFWDLADLFTFTGWTNLNNTLGDPGDVEKVVACYGNGLGGVDTGSVYYFVLANKRAGMCGGVRNCLTDSFIYTARRTDGSFTPWSADIRTTTGSNHGKITDIACAFKPGGIELAMVNSTGSLYIDDLTTSGLSPFVDLSTYTGSMGLYNHVAMTNDGAYGVDLQILASTTDNNLWHATHYMNVAPGSDPWSVFGFVYGQTGYLPSVGNIVDLAAGFLWDAQFAVVLDNGDAWLTIRNNVNGAWTSWYSGATAIGQGALQFLQWLFFNYTDASVIS